MYLVCYLGSLIIGVLSAAMPVPCSIQIIKILDKPVDIISCNICNIGFWSWFVASCYQERVTFINQTCVARNKSISNYLLKYSTVTRCPLSSKILSVILHYLSIVQHLFCFLILQSAVLPHLIPSLCDGVYPCPNHDCGSKTHHWRPHNCHWLKSSRLHMSTVHSKID